MCAHVPVCVCVCAEGTVPGWCPSPVSRCNSKLSSNDPSALRTAPPAPLRGQNQQLRRSSMLTSGAHTQTQKPDPFSMGRPLLCVKFLPFPPLSFGCLISAKTERTKTRATYIFKVLKSRTTTSKMLALEWL